MPSSLVINLVGDKIMLPAGIRAKVDQYWQELVTKNPRLHKGEAFTVTSVKKVNDNMTVTLAETDYAHYLYSQQVGHLEDYAVRVIHSAALVITGDNKFIFGSMGGHTSRPGIIQCAGGGIDHDDIEDDIVDIEHNTARELAEELGIDVYDKSRVAAFYPAYLKSGGPTGKMTVAYVLRIKQTADQFMGDYDKFARTLVASNEEPEFGELFCLDNSQEAVDEFITKYGERLNEYMAVLFQAAHPRF
jgi:8-oxo-dGTP pyrophosphatase MutT (NUDIX family)